MRPTYTGTIDIHSDTMPRSATPPGTLLHCIGNRVAVRPVEDESVLPSGLIVPETAKQRPVRGVVVAVGPGLQSPKTGAMAVVPGVSVGDLVVFTRYADTIDPYVIDGQKITFLDAREILGVLEKE